MQRKQSKRAARRAAGRATNELIDRRSERQRTLLHVLAQVVPRLEAVFARDHGLRVVQGEAHRAELGDGFPAQRGNA